jgi:hypothetical protein
MDWAKGDRVRLVHTNDPWTRLRPGTEGTVTTVADALGHQQIWVAWDNGSRLAMIPDDGDQIERVT